MSFSKKIFDSQQFQLHFANLIHNTRQKPTSGTDAVLAEFGTLHLEFMYLSEVTGDMRFREKALKIREVLKNANKPKGFYWNYANVNTGKFSVSM